MLLPPATQSNEFDFKHLRVKYTLTGFSGSRSSLESTSSRDKEADYNAYQLYGYFRKRTASLKCGNCYFLIF